MKTTLKHETEFGAVTATGRTKAEAWQMIIDFVAAGITIAEQVKK